MKHDVFISHCHQDKPVADAACAGLEAAGIRCWIAPRDIMPGSEWGASIIEALTTCRVMVVVFSGYANASKQVLREVERCVSHGIILVPLRVEDVTPSGSMEYFLGTPHWLDALTPPLEQHIARLVNTIQRILEANPRVPPTIIRAPENPVTEPVVAAPPPHLSEPVVLKPTFEPPKAAPPLAEPPIVVPPLVQPQAAAQRKRTNTIVAVVGVAIVAVVLIIASSKKRSAYPDGFDPSVPPDSAFMHPAEPLNPPPPPPPPPSSATTGYAELLTSGLSLLKSGDSSGAVRQYLAATLQYPDSIGGHSALASLYGALRRYRDAVEQTRIWTRVAPNDAVGHNNLAWWLIYLEEYSESATEINTAVRLDGKAAYMWDTVGFLNAKLGRFKDAADAFAYAVKLDPNTPAYAERLAIVQGGRQPPLP